jgi:hypothetical protein
MYGSFWFTLLKSFEFLRESWWPCNRVAGPGWLVGTGSSGSHEVDSPQRSTTDDRRTGREIAVEFPYTFPFHSVSFSFLIYAAWFLIASTSSAVQLQSLARTKLRTPGPGHTE